MGVASRSAPGRRRPVERGFSLRRRQGPWKDALRRRMLAAADLLGVLLTAAAVARVDGLETGLWLAAGTPLWLLLAKASGLYDRDQSRIQPQTIDELSTLFQWATLGTLVVCLLMPGELLSVHVVVVVWAGVFASTTGLRAVARAVWRRAVPRERALVLGSGPVADALARKLVLEPGHHVDVGELVALDGDDRDAAVELLGRLGDHLHDGRFERVILASHDLDEPTLSRIVSSCRERRVKLSVAPPLRAMLGTAVELNHLAELPLIEFRTWDPSRTTMLLKRALDVTLGVCALVVLAPLMVALAAAVRLDSPGPALFRQRRAGRNGQPFTMLKYRTMVVGAERMLDDVLAIEELTDPVFKLHDDPRVTRVGRVLRALSLDELPQLLNVVRGEMSLVGPRPEEVWLTDRYDEADRFRFQMRPGLTGPMQVHGRAQLSFQERMAVEREYVENHSLGRDFAILLRTLPAVVRRRGAY